MPDDFLRLPADGTGKRMRSYRGGVTEDNHHTQYMVPTVDRITSGAYACASFRMAGVASNPINLCTIEVAASAIKSVMLRRLAVDVDVSAVTAYLLTPYFRLWKLLPCRRVAR